MLGVTDCLKKMDKLGGFGHGSERAADDALAAAGTVSFGNTGNPILPDRDGFGRAAVFTGPPILDDGMIGAIPGAKAAFDAAGLVNKGFIVNKENCFFRTVGETEMTNTILAVVGYTIAMHFASVAAFLKNTHYRTFIRFKNSF
ncbi:hypothetical protein HMPREF0322_00020 [Desulfitobacterium hafniense DP7]|uniref:Uncharacterized protein n=1 Tax=Desulfitobacterium hafniense DP7 TaxID=537010 RepID=G9XGF4_DESHA|nr:hypothetical protein HMPREF0322_00020 [Desulfitobacterium hafniense DP7]